MKLKCALLAVVLFCFSKQQSSAQQTPTGTAALQVQVAMPPFLYEGDRLEVTATASCAAPGERTVQLQLQLLDAGSSTSVDGWFQNIFPVQYVTVESGKAAEVRFPLEVPYQFRKHVRWQIILQDKVLKEGTVAVRAVADSTQASQHKKAPFQIQKQLSLKRQHQPQWHPVQDTTTIRVGDSLKIQLRVTAANAIAHIRLTDALAATFSAVPTASGVHGGTPSEDSTCRIFTLPLLQKGLSLFEYNVATTHAGVFHLGPTILQSGTGITYAVANAGYIRVEE